MREQRDRRRSFQDGLLFLRLHPVRTADVVAYAARERSWRFVPASCRLRHRSSAAGLRSSLLSKLTPIVAYLHWINLRLPSGFATYTLEACRKRRSREFAPLASRFMWLSVLSVSV